MSELIQHWVARQAAERPADDAIVTETQVLSFAELHARGNQLATALRSAGVAPGDRVGVLMRKSPEFVLAILASLRCGAILVPLDVQSPADRLIRIVTSADPRVLLSCADHQAAVGALLAACGEGTRVGWLDSAAASARGAGSDPGGAFDAHGVADASAADHPDRLAPDGTALLLYTSGSTGQPKGVMVRHDSLAEIISWGVEYFGVGPADRLAGHPPLIFDISYFDLLASWRSGASWHPVARELNLIPHKLVEFVRQRRLTHWFSVPSVLSQIARFDALTPGAWSSVREIYWAGEVFQTPALRYWMKRMPQTRFTNLYGPTETTIVSSFYSVPAPPAEDAAPLPVGFACCNESLHVLDEQGLPRAAGEQGGICIGGAGLANGYWRDPERTAAAFQETTIGGRLVRVYRTGDLGAWGAGGELHLHGRADGQIKSRGYRIELGEIEAALARLEGLVEAAVVAVDAPALGSKLIACAYVPRGADVSPASMREQLARLLPAYMLPQKWQQLAALPRTASGKLDRRAISAHFAAP